MANQKRVAKQPMLYIAQPEFKPAEVQMQTSFRTQRPAKPTTNTSDLSAKETELRRRNQNQLHETIDEQPANADQEEETAEEPSPKEEASARIPTSRERRQRFQDLSLEEKVNYFFDLSPHVPKMKCDVSTDEDHYRGYITNYEDGIVHMKVFTRPFHQKIAFEEITDIRLIGF